MSIEELPKHLKDELERQANKEEAERRQREIDRNTCKVNNVYTFVVCLVSCIYTES